MLYRTRILAHLALKSIVKNWRHSLATMLAILGGFAAVSLFDGFLASVKQMNEERYVHKGMVAHVLVEKAGSAEHLLEDTWRYSLTKSDQDGITKILGEDSRVQETMRYLWVSGLISNGESSAIFFGAGYDEAQGLKLRGDKWAWNTVAGNPLSAAPPSGGLMLGMGLARRMGCEFETNYPMNPDGSYVAKAAPLHCTGAGLQVSVTTEHSQVNAVTLPVVGVTDMQLREFNDKVLAMPIATAQQLFDTDRITRVVVLLKDPSDISAFISDFTQKSKAAGLDLEAVKWLDHPVAAVAKGGLEVMSVFRALFLGVVAIIAAMSVANSMMKSINERIREIGTLRSFGFRRLDIMLLFSFEGFFLGMLSCVAGIFVTTALAFGISHLGLSFKAGVLSTPLPVTFDLAFSVWIVTALALGLITFLASWLVARRAARMVISDALRSVA